MSTVAVEDFVNVQEAAAIIGCTPAYVRQLLIAKDLKGIKANARAWLIRREDAEALTVRVNPVGRPRISSKPPVDNSTVS
jgi:hypothetical protein